MITCEKAPNLLTPTGDSSVGQRVTECPSGSGGRYAYREGSGHISSFLNKCGLLSDQTPAQILLPESFASQIFKNNIYYNPKVGMGTHFNLKE
jgi:hypothetical protein